MVSKYFDPISASPLHIYHSALPLMPIHTTLFRQFRDELVIAEARLSAILKGVEAALREP
jgi:hypothetical protein